MNIIQISKRKARTEYRPATVKVIEFNTQGIICQSGTLGAGMTRTEGIWEEDE